MIMSSQMLLMWIGEKKQDPLAVQAAQEIDRAVTAVISEMKTVTPDLKGTASTGDMGDAICQKIRTI